SQGLFALQLGQSNSLKRDLIPLAWLALSSSSSYASIGMTDSLRWPFWRARASDIPANFPTPRRLNALLASHVRLGQAKMRRGWPLRGALPRFAGRVPATIRGFCRCSEFVQVC